MNLFEEATKKRYRFTSDRGLMTVEQLWDLPLQSTGTLNLDHIAQSLNKEIGEHQESFVSKTKTVNKELVNKLEIVKHIIAVKLELQEKRKKAADRKELREKILAAMAEKQDATIKNRSMASLEKMLKELGNDEEENEDW